MKYIPFILVFFLIFSRSSFASIPEVKVYYQHGERTTEEIVLDTDDLDYSFNKYYLKIDEKLTKDLSYYFNYVDYTRDYEVQDDLNNYVRDYKGGWDYSFFDEKGESLKLDFNLGYREKEYEEKENLDFNRIKVDSQLTYKDEGVWWGSVKGGVSYYNFERGESKDRHIYFEKITVKKYFDNERFTLIGDLKLKQLDFKEKNDKNEYEVCTGFDIKTDCSILEKISLRAENGERWTIEDEEYEEERDFSYKYTLIKARTFHKLTDNLETSLTGQLKDKDYDEVDYDYNSFLIGNDWKWRYYLSGKRKRYFQVGLDIIHGETEYSVREDSSHYKNGVTMELAYKMWGMWSYSVEFGGVGYRYELEEKDRDVYHMAAELNRGFFDNRFKLNLEYKYQIKDYLNEDKGNVYQNSFLIGGEYRF